MTNNSYVFRKSRKFTRSKANSLSNRNLRQNHRSTQFSKLLIAQLCLSRTSTTQNSNFHWDVSKMNSFPIWNWAWAFIAASQNLNHVHFYQWACALFLFFTNWTVFINFWCRLLFIRSEYVAVLIVITYEYHSLNSYLTFLLCCWIHEILIKMSMTILCHYKLFMLYPVFYQFENNSLNIGLLVSSSFNYSSNLRYRQSDCFMLLNLWIGKSEQIEPTKQGVQKTIANGKVNHIHLERNTLIC